MAVGAIAFTNGWAYHTFCGEIAVARIYDSCKTKDEVTARYNEVVNSIIPTLQ
jgi:hypothetical protein